MQRVSLLRKKRAIEQYGTGKKRKTVRDRREQNEDRGKKSEDGGGQREREREVIVTTDIGVIRNRHPKHWVRLQSTGRALRN